MKNSMRHIGKKIISIILVIASLVSVMSVACFAQEDLSTEEIDTEYLSQLIMDNLYSKTEEESTEWEEYVGDLDTFVYGLMVQEYEQSYEVFNAAAKLSDGTTVYGIGFTDYGSYIETVDGKGYFPAGFIGLIGEQGIPGEDAAEGLEIINTDSLDENFGFVLAYDVEPYLEHCVIWGQYLQYGVDENGVITYSAREYERGDFDESLGALYSYDESRYLYDPDVGEYYNTSGTSLYEEIDYEELQAQINEILEEQEQNFAVSDVETIVYESQEAMISYLLSLQDETFMGYDVDELVSIAEELDPMESVRITQDGLFVVDMDTDPPEEATALVKWLTGCVCGVVMIASVALEVFVPALMPAASAIQGACIEVFMEVVIQNHTLEDANWALVGVAAASAVLISWGAASLGASAATIATEAMTEAIDTGTMAVTVTEILEVEEAEALGQLIGKVVQIVATSMVSGATGVAYTLIEGGDSKEAVNAFVTGAIVGAVLSIGGEFLAKGLGALGSAIGKALPNAWKESLTSKAGAVSEWIAGHQVKLFSDAVEDVLIPKSVYQAAREVVYKYQCERALAWRIIQLPRDISTDFIKFDLNGNVLTKKALAENGGNCIIKLADNCDPQIRQLFDELGITEIVVENGEPIFPSSYRFVPKNGITSNRDQNMTNYFTQLAEEWKGHIESIPEELLEQLGLSDTQIENLTKKTLEEAFSEAGITLHESIDGYVYTVDTYLHTQVSHGGGVALAKALECIDAGKDYFSELITAHPIAVFGTLIVTEGSN